MAKVYWTIKEGQQTVPNQLFYDSLWSISIKGEVAACFDKEAIYDHTYRKNRISAILASGSTTLSNGT